ncbi:tail fiber assembly protein [Escherichia coli]|uniref:tail fiber assembly protein n=1 Tax=Escherichia coli TaxID=562 RepID=UPI002FCFEC05
MTNYIFSPSKNAFYPCDLKSFYVSAGSWPNDGIDVADSVFMEFTGQSPEGKIRIVDENNLPAWGDIPPPAKEDLIAIAESKKTQLRAMADSEISWRQDAVDAALATEEETLALAEWKKFRVRLMRVDVTDPDWPELPKD